MTNEIINRLTNRTSFSYNQITKYIQRVTAGGPVADEILAGNIIEADQCGIDLDLLGWY